MAVNTRAGNAAAGREGTGRWPGWSAVHVLVLLALVLAVVGTGIAAYLAYENVQGQTSVCTVVHGCATVQKSSYGKFLGVPVSVPGLALYVVLAGSAVAWLRDVAGRRDEVSLLAFSGALFGFLFSGYLTYVEAFVLDAWCIYCIASAVLMTLLMLSWFTVLAMAVRERRAE
jgi:uncharacterized membrane protein